MKKKGQDNEPTDSNNPTQQHRKTQHFFSLCLSFSRIVLMDLKRTMRDAFTIFSLRHELSQTMATGIVDCKSGT